MGFGGVSMGSRALERWSAQSCFLVALQRSDLSVGSCLGGRAAICRISTHFWYVYEAGAR